MRCCFISLPKVSQTKTEKEANPPPPKPPSPKESVCICFQGNMASEDSEAPKSASPRLSLKRRLSKDGSNQCMKKSKINITCPICDENIKEATKYRKGDDSIYCEGYCDAWIHRRCAGLSAVNFNMLSEAEDQTFFCIHCD